MPEFPVFATYLTHYDQRDLFRTKDLVTQWARSYPMIFDDDDIRIAESQAEMGYHFYEWLAAVLIYHTCGYLSLIEQYQFKSHTRKHSILRQLTSPSILEFIQYHPEFGKVQCPDLLVYNPDLSEWFFCEVKGPSDSLTSRQIEFFRALASKSGKDIQMVKFVYLGK